MGPTAIEIIAEIDRRVVIEEEQRDREVYGSESRRWRQGRVVGLLDMKAWIETQIESDAKEMEKEVKDKQA